MLAAGVTVNATQIEKSSDARKMAWALRKPASRWPQIQIPFHTQALGDLPGTFPFWIPVWLAL
jgi:hypothetical protein